MQAIELKGPGQLVTRSIAPGAVQTAFGQLASGTSDDNKLMIHPN